MTMIAALLHNWHLKVIAGVLAVMVWFTIQRATSTEVVMIYNVRVEPHLPQGWRAMQVEPSRVAITIRGERAGVTAITADHFLAQPIIGPTLKRGEMDVDLKPSDVKAPPNIRVINVEPERVAVILESTVAAGGN